MKNKHRLSWAMLIIGISTGFAAAQPQPPLTPISHLYGHWESLNGDYALELLGNQTAVLRRGDAKEGSKHEPFTGTFAARGAAWRLQVTSVEGKTLTFGIVWTNPRRLNLLDAKNQTIPMVRVHAPFERLDRNSDNVISQLEAADSPLTARFQEADRDRNFSIDRAEYAYFWDKVYLGR